MFFVLLFHYQDIFERVNKAYEFLCSRTAHQVDGPDPRNILLVIRTQSILFSRYKDGEKQFMNKEHSFLQSLKKKKSW